MKYYATAAFAMESVAAAELRALGMQEVHIEGNRVFFEGSQADAARACVFLRSVDRVFLLAGRFSAMSFDELFAATEALPWAQLLARDGRFLVSARCVQSALMSQSDMQSVAKKAIIKKMQKRYAIHTFPETGADYRIDFSIYKNVE